MDPNATLEQIRRLFSDTDTWDGLTLAEVKEHFEALDQWLSRGGFLPAAWNASHA